MRSIPRKTLLVSVTAALALGTGGIAWADGASDNNSRVQGAISPNALPASSFAKGSLFNQVTTVPEYGAPSALVPNSGIPDKAPERVYIDYDDSIKLTVNNALPKCQAGDGTLLGGAGLLATLAQDDTEGAIDDCDADDDSTPTVNRKAGAKTILGSGNAIARTNVNPNPPPVVVSDLKFTVTAFNGPTSAQGPNCTTPADATGGPPGCDFEGGDPTIILFARNDVAGQSAPVLGEIQQPADPTGPAIPAGVDGGTRLAVTDAPDVLSDTGSLTLFNSVISKSWNNGKSGNKKKTYNYVTAKCDDGNTQLDFGGTWVYDDNTTDTGTWSQDCAAT